MKPVHLCEEILFWLMPLLVRTCLMRTTLITWLICLESYFLPIFAYIWCYIFHVLDVLVRVCRCSIMKSTFNIWCVLSICLKLMQFIVALHKGWSHRSYTLENVPWNIHFLTREFFLLQSSCSFSSSNAFYGIVLKFTFLQKVILRWNPFLMRSVWELQ